MEMFILLAFILTLIGVLSIWVPDIFREIFGKEE